MIRLLARPGVVSALAFAASGATFVAVNLLLARILSPQDFGMLSLLISLTFLGGRIAPLGFDGVISRRVIDCGGYISRRILPGAILIGVAFALLAHTVYEVDPALCAALVVAITAQGIYLSVAAQHQARQEFVRSLAYLRSADVLLAIPAAGTLVLAAAGFPAVFVSWAALLAVVAAIAVRRPGPTAQPAPVPSLGWKEGAAFLGVQLSADLLVQMERLLTPYLLDLHAMATLSIALSIVGPPFRLLQLTTGYALQPMLRAAPDARSRLQLIRRDGSRAVIVTAVACVALWLLTPLLVSVFLGDKYRVSSALLAALLAGGMLKVASGFVKAGVTALATEQQLRKMAVAGWIGVAVGVAGAWLGSRFGLPALVWGVSSGWAVRVGAGGWLITRQLRSATTRT